MNPVAPDSRLPCYTASFYPFVDWSDFADLQKPLQALCDARQVKGLVLLAAEGINGTLSGKAEDVLAVFAHLRLDPRLHGITHKAAWVSRAPSTPASANGRCSNGGRMRRRTPRPEFFRPAGISRRGCCARWPIFSNVPHRR